MEAIDHVVILVRDLDAAARGLRKRYGLGAVPGGRHDGGTENWVVPLANSQYVELLHVWSPELLATDPLSVQALARLDRVGDHFVSWAVRTDDIDAVARVVGTTPTAGRVVLADGSVSSWRIVDLSEPVPGRPFFIQYDAAEQRPAMWAQRYAEAAHDGRIGGFIEVTVGGVEHPAPFLNGRLAVRWDRLLPEGVQRVTVERDGEPIEISAQG